MGNKGEDPDDSTTNSSDDDDDQQEPEQFREGNEQAREPLPIQRSAIISGFNNLKKELSILSPLRHPHVIQLFGVSARPLGKNWFSVELTLR